MSEINIGIALMIIGAVVLFALNMLLIKRNLKLEKQKAALEKMIEEHF